MSLKTDLVLGAVAIAAPLVGALAVKGWKFLAAKYKLPDDPELDDELEVGVEAVVKETAAEALAGKFDPAAEVKAVVAAESELKAKEVIKAQGSIPNLAATAVTSFDPTKSEEKK